MITSLQNYCLGFSQFETFDRKIEQRFIQQNGRKIQFFINLRKTAIYVREMMTINVPDFKKKYRFFGALWNYISEMV